MHGIVRAVGRLLVMGAVMGAVLVGAIVAGLGATTAIAVGIVLAGTVGLVGVARKPRPRRSTATEIDAMLAAEPLERRAQPATPVAVKSLTDSTRVDAMAPQRTIPADVEANMPRWRRPSLLEARRSDPTRVADAYRAPMRFDADAGTDVDLRIVRYAVVPVLDRPDEVLGLRLSDLGAGDEVHVIGASGAFLEVVCPNGDRGFVHRTTLGQPVASEAPDGRRQPMPQEADDALSALLTARGLI